MVTPKQAAHLILDFLAGFNEGRDPGKVVYADQGTAILQAFVEGVEFEMRLFRRTKSKRQQTRRPTRKGLPVILKFRK